MPFEPPPLEPHPVVSRADLVRRLSHELSESTSPRLHLLVIVSLAGLAAFLTSVLLLWSPAEVFELMAPRYAVAVVAGYGVFLLLIRAWIALQRPPGDGDLSWLDWVEPGDVTDLVEVLPDATARQFAGGRSGGGGASDQWASPRSMSVESDSSWGFDLDDGVFWLIAAAACVVGGGLAIAYVLYTAPILLAEVALDAAIVSALYRRLRHDQRGYWLTTAVRRTWGPALILVAFAFVAGVALQYVAPSARSIGAVMQSVSTIAAR